MLNKIIIAILGLLLLSGCTDGFRGYFKRSANNKIIDSKGFAGGKRPPLYNKKYISMAKKNIVEENFDDEEEDLLSEDETETINPTLRNRQMYLKMVKQDAERRKRQKLNQDDYYPSLNEANSKVQKKNSTNENNNLHKELEQIKAMLHETKKDLEKYSCPARNEKLPVYMYKDNKKLDRENDKVTNNTNRSARSRMQKKFLSQDYDEINVKDLKSEMNSEQEKLKSSHRAI